MAKEMAQVVERESRVRIPQVFEVVDGFYG